MGAMMLYCPRFTSGDICRMIRRSILRVAIMHQKQIASVDFVHRDQVFNGLRESLESLIVREIANMLAYKSVTFHHKRNRVLEVRSQSQHGALCWKFRHCTGCISARPAKNYRTECSYASY